MRFPQPLLRGVLLRRYKRFLADVRLASGEEVVAYCPNPGSMLSVSAPGSEVWLSPAVRTGRSLAYHWELVRCGDALVGINTGRANALVAEAIARQRVPELSGYDSVRREVRYGRNSRIDLLLQSIHKPTCFVEVKNVTLRRSLDREAPVEFPDSVTARGRKHMEELAAAARQGARAVVFYVAQRDDAPSLGFASDLDAGYTQAVRDAVIAGVENLCYRCDVSTDAIFLAAMIPIHLPAPLPD